MDKIEKRPWMIVLIIFSIAFLSIEIFGQSSVVNLSQQTTITTGGTSNLNTDSVNAIIGDYVIDNGLVSVLNIVEDNDPDTLLTINGMDVKKSAVQNIASIVFDFLKMDSIGIVNNNGTVTYYDSTDFASFGAGVPGGNTTELQYNDAGLFNGNSKITVDKTNSTLNLGLGSVAQPTLTLETTGNKSGIYASADGNIKVSIDGVAKVNVSASDFYTTGGTAGPGLSANAIATTTNSTVRPIYSSNSGLGARGAPDYKDVALVAEGENVLTAYSAGDSILFSYNIKARGKNIITDSIFTLKSGAWADYIVEDWKPGNLIIYSLKSRNKGHLQDLQLEDKNAIGMWDSEIQKRIEGNVAINERQQIWIFNNRILIILLFTWNFIITFLLWLKKY